MLDGEVTAQLQRHPRLPQKLSRAIRKYGKNSFKIELIKNDAKNFQELAQQEIDEIKKRGTISDGYNISAGGNLSGVKPIVVDGILYGSRAAAAESFGIPQSKFNHRLKVGKSPEQAAEIAKREKYERVRINTKYGSWPSLKSACLSLD